MRPLRASGSILGAAWGGLGASLRDLEASEDGGLSSVILLQEELAREQDLTQDLQSKIQSLLEKNASLSQGFGGGWGRRKKPKHGFKVNHVSLMSPYMDFLSLSFFLSLSLSLSLTRTRSLYPSM